jgi:hypothetical protein
MNLGYFSNPRNEEEGTFSEYRTGNTSKKRDTASKQSSGCVPHSEMSG